MRGAINSKNAKAKAPGVSGKSGTKAGEGCGEQAKEGHTRSVAKRTVTGTSLAKVLMRAATVKDCPEKKLLCGVIVQAFSDQQLNKYIHEVAAFYTSDVLKKYCDILGLKFDFVMHMAAQLKNWEKVQNVSISRSATFYDRHAAAGHA